MCLGTEFLRGCLSCGMALGVLGPPRSLASHCSLASPVARDLRPVAVPWRGGTVGLDRGEVSFEDGRPVTSSVSRNSPPVTSPSETPRGQGWEGNKHPHLITILILLGEERRYRARWDGTRDPAGPSPGFAPSYGLAGSGHVRGLEQLPSDDGPVIACRNASLRGRKSRAGSRF